MYLDAYIEQCPAYGWQGGPEFNTQVVQMANGRENRNALWANARHRYQAPYQNISKESYRGIKQMHLTCRGRLHCFKFRDALDYSATDEEFGEGDGTTTSFQLGKISSVDGIFYFREVYVIDSATVEVNGTPTAVTVDQDRGIVTFSVAPSNGAVLTWTGEFDVWVRFDQDYLPFSIDSLNAVNGSIDLLEQPPPPPGS